MKFSIKSILVLMVIAAFAFNAWRLHSQNRLAQLDIAGLKQINASLDLDVKNFELQQKAYENFFAADAVRREQFAKADSLFRTMVDQSRDFTIKDPTQPQIFRLATYDTRMRSQEGWRIYVPETVALNLTLSFLPSNHLVDSVNRTRSKIPLDRATLFEPQEPFSMRLPAGNSDVILEWLDNTEEVDCRLLLDGEVVLELSFRDEHSGYSSSASIVGDSIDGNRPYSLYRLTPYREKAYSETIWLRVTPAILGEQQ